MKVLVYGSSSKGNCSLVTFDNGVSAFFDAGISPSKIKEKKTGKYVFVTHTHADHAKYAKELAEKYGCKIVLSQGSKNRLGLPDDSCIVMHTYCDLTPAMCLQLVKATTKEPKTPYAVAVKTQHDDLEPCAFALFSGNESFFYCMDSGVIPNTHRMLFDCIFVEANHTPNRLAESLKDEETGGIVSGRVNSGFGHVGLMDVYEEYKSILRYEPTILLGHRSSRNFDEAEYDAMPQDFLERSVLVESGKEYNTRPF